VSYVDAGYVAALGGSFLYAVSLVLRRRRWERALRMSQPHDAEAHDAETDGAAAPGERS
jgi:hypothetical protein